MPPRVLVIAEAANPTWVSVPLVGWSLATAIARKATVHLVTQIRNRDAIVSAGLREDVDFTAIDSESVARPLSRLSRGLLRSSGVGWTMDTALSTLAYYHFERLVWKRFEAEIEQGKFDLVHRITPLSPTTPSVLAPRSVDAGVPFIVGPLNGGVPWPKQFSVERRKEREWLSYLRAAHRLLPGYGATLRSAAAILVGSRDTLKQLPQRVHHKCIYLPENGIDPARFSRRTMRDGSTTSLRACFVGRLVPYKGPDMLLDALTPFLRGGQLKLDIVGHGPMESELQTMIRNSGISDAATLHGWVEHRRVQDVLSKADIFVFPSIREFGGGAVLEAMALGVVPVVVDYGGPGEIVDDSVGYKIQLGTREGIVQELRTVVESVIAAPSSLPAKSRACLQRVQERYTWDSKAEQVLNVYDWVLRRRDSKPQFFDSAALA